MLNSGGESPQEVQARRDLYRFLQEEQSLAAQLRDNLRHNLLADLGHHANTNAGGDGTQSDWFDRVERDTGEAEQLAQHPNFPKEWREAALALVEFLRRCIRDASRWREIANHHRRNLAVQIQTWAKARPETEEYITAEVIAQALAQAVRRGRDQMEQLGARLRRPGEQSDRQDSQANGALLQELDDMVRAMLQPEPCGYPAPVREIIAQEVRNGQRWSFEIMISPAQVVPLSSPESPPSATGPSV